MKEMPNENGDWIMKGLDWNDPMRIRTPMALIDTINDVGFLPLFANEIPGFSAEEHVSPLYWWTGNPEQDPWEWRRLIAQTGQVAYGKFFNRKAGFISKEWFPYFANYRRDGYDFDARWDDELASRRSKRIIDLFETREELFSFEVKKLAGFGKDGEKNFDGVITDLQMQTYLCIRDFRRKKRKADGAEYGWHVAVYTTPEKLWDYQTTAAAYGEEPSVSAERIFQRIKERFPETTEKQIRKMMR